MCGVICWWVSQWWVVLVLLGVYDALVDVCGLWEHLRSFRKVKWRSGVSPRFHLLVLCLVHIKQIRRQGESKIPLRNPSDMKLLLRPSQAKISYWTESHLESCQTSTMELFCKNSQWSKDVDCFRKKAPLQIYSWIPKAPPIGKVL